MTDISFKKDKNFYVAHFAVSGVLTLHIEMQGVLVSTFIGIRSTDEGRYKDVYQTNDNPVDGDFKIGDGNNTKYVEVRCSQEPYFAQFGGEDVTQIEE